MLKFFRIRFVIRVTSILSLIAFLNLIHGCYYYKVNRTTEPAGPALMKLEGNNKLIILHSADSTWQFRNIATDGDSISGFLWKLQGHEAYKTTIPEINNRYKKSDSGDEFKVSDEVHIYVADNVQIKDGKAVFATRSVDRIELYDPAKGATTASWVFGAIGVGALIFVAIGVIVALTKESCPFIYVSDGTKEKFIGEIYSGAIYPSVERDDYLPLPNPEPGQKEYKIKMTNEVHEIQNTNLIELNVFDHPGDVDVLVDKYGNYQTTYDLILPAEAKNLRGDDVLELIKSKDTLSYYCDENIKDPPVTDGIILKFDKPGDSGTAKLRIRAKNTFWLDYVFARFHELFGKEYDCWVEKQTTDLARKMKNWSVEQKIPLCVYIEKNGKWEFVDYYNVTGPMAAKEDILSFNISEIKTDFVRIKLEFGYLFWDIDYAAIDYSINVPVVQRIAQFETATDNKDKDVKDLLKSSDMLYYVQPEVGDAVDMTFSIPAPIKESQTYILHSRGHYKILMNQTGDQQVRQLLAFRKKGHFPEFSNEIFREQSGMDHK
jgi:hypothetical protein